MTSEPADYSQWSLALAGGKPGLHYDEPWCGYFKMRDRRGLNASLAPIKRPWIVCAIWRDEKGALKAERAGEMVPVDWIWPFCAKYPIPHEIYAYWHQHDGRWPEVAA